jgi:exosome complex component RRP42
MAPYTNIPLSPAELSYLHISLQQDPPVRPDGRTTTQFRPLVAETDILPSANGSARICFADGTEAIVGIKAEVEKSRSSRGNNAALVFADDASQPAASRGASGGDVDMDDATADDEGGAGKSHGGKGDDDWLEMSIEIPGLRDDDVLPVFLAAMLTEALLADGAVRDRLWINTRFHWRLSIDVGTHYACAVPRGFSFVRLISHYQRPSIPSPSRPFPSPCLLRHDPSIPKSHTPACLIATSAS